VQPLLARLVSDLRPDPPRIFLIPGNDDPASEDASWLAGEAAGVWTYTHGRHVGWEGFDVLGYGCVPPTPFRLKDWERYDVSRHVEPGCVSPEEGVRTAAALPAAAIRYRTIAQDLEELAAGRNLSRAICLFHTPPYGTALDRAALDGRMVDHVPLDVHVGSIAVRRFIESRQPLLTLHGHIHESARLTGSWQERLGSTLMINAAHDGPELALVRFDPADLDGVTRELIG
jgi:Icc-related predicted phosphoesterase